MWFCSVVVCFTGYCRLHFQALILLQSNVRYLDSWCVCFLSLQFLCSLESPSCALFCFAAMMCCPRCNSSLPNSTAGKQNWSDFQTRPKTPVCLDKMSGRRFNCCQGCSDQYFRLYPKFVWFNQTMTFGDHSWCALCNDLRAAWPAADWLQWYLACNVPLRIEFEELLTNIGVESGR